MACFDSSAPDDTLMDTDFHMILVLYHVRKIVSKLKIKIGPKLKIALHIMYLYKAYCSCNDFKRN